MIYVITTEKSKKHKFSFDKDIFYSHIFGYNSGLSDALEYRSFEDAQLTVKKLRKQTPEYFINAVQVLESVKRRNKKKMKNIPAKFLNDPLYKAVLTAKNQAEYKKAINTLVAIRGRNATVVLKKAIS